MRWNRAPWITPLFSCPGLCHRDAFSTSLSWNPGQKSLDSLFFWVPMVHSGEVATVWFGDSTHVALTQYGPRWHSNIQQSVMNSLLCFFNSFHLMRGACVHVHYPQLGTISRCCFSFLRSLARVQNVNHSCTISATSRDPAVHLCRQSLCKYQFKIRIDIDINTKESLIVQYKYDCICALSKEV